jgi:hypothetical protein
MNSYPRLASLIAKNRSRNFIAIGGLFSAFLVTRDEETNEHQHQHKVCARDKQEASSSEARVSSFFPNDLFSNMTACDFMQGVRRRNTHRKLREEMTEQKLGSVYKIDWTMPLGEGGFGAVYLGQDRKTGALGKRTLFCP